MGLPACPGPAKPAYSVAGKPPTRTGTTTTIPSATRNSSSIPEVRTLRQKLEILCRETGRAMRWNTELAKEWIAGQRESELIFYVDGHVRVYHGDLTPLPHHYVARQRLCLRATTDYWINAVEVTRETQAHRARAVFSPGKRAASVVPTSPTEITLPANSPPMLRWR